MSQPKFPDFQMKSRDSAAVQSENEFSLGKCLENLVGWQTMKQRESRSGRGSATALPPGVVPDSGISYLAKLQRPSRATN